MRRTSLLRSAATLVAVLSAATANAQTLKFDDICKDQKVDRETLAVAAFNQYKISFFPLMWVANHPVVQKNGDPAPLSAAWRVLTEDTFCGQRDRVTHVVTIEKDANGTAKCDAADIAKIDSARTTLKEMLLPGHGFVAPEGTTWASYSTTPGATLGCTTAPQVAAFLATETVKEPEVLKSFPLRIRGSTDGLQYDRTDPRFAGVDKAALSLENDGVKATKVFKVTAILALAVTPWDDKSKQFIPYVGFDINRTTKKDGTVDTKDDMLSAGFMFAYQPTGSLGSSIYIVQPEYAADRTERSEVFTTTLRYVPIQRWVNEPLPVGPYVSFLPKADIRMRYGHFIKQGSRTDEDSRDFLRLGTQLGFTASGGIDWLPVELTTTWTYLHGFTRAPRDLSQLNVVFSAYADAKKYFGIDLGYKRGRIDDLSSREDTWSIGLGAKF